jgi:hypothetical protein
MVFMLNYTTINLNLHSPEGQLQKILFEMQHGPGTKYACCADSKKEKIIRHPAAEQVPDRNTGNILWRYRVYCLLGGW